VVRLLGEYLELSSPLGELWRDCVEIVYRDSPRHAHLERLSAPARVNYVLGELHGEILNGGLSQFFSNSSGDHAAETRAALDAIGANAVAALFDRALVAFACALPPGDRVVRCEQLFAFEADHPDVLPALDDLYDRAMQEELSAQRLAYLRRHATSPLTS
jgi:hypothetical protein